MYSYNEMLEFNTGNKNHDTLVSQIFKNLMLLCNHKLIERIDNKIVTKEYLIEDLIMIILLKDGFFTGNNEFLNYIMLYIEPYYTSSLIQLELMYKSGTLNTLYINKKTYSGKPISTKSKEYYDIVFLNITDELKNYDSDVHVSNKSIIQFPIIKERPSQTIKDDDEDIPINEHQKVFGDFLKDPSIASYETMVRIYYSVFMFTPKQHTEIANKIAQKIPYFIVRDVQIFWIHIYSLHHANSDKTFPKIEFIL
jgi:hypothetical protein